MRLSYSRLYVGCYCPTSRENPDIYSVPNPFVTVPGIIRGTALGLIAIGLNEYRVPVEPRLMPYVCEMGLSTYC
jgi:hypothetical protein